MKNLTFEERELRDALATRLLAGMIPTLPGPQSAISALPVIFIVAEGFLTERRKVLAQDEADDGEEAPPAPTSPVVLS